MITSWKPSVIIITIMLAKTDFIKPLYNKQIKLWRLFSQYSILKNAKKVLWIILCENKLFLINN